MCLTSLEYRCYCLMAVDMGCVPGRACVSAEAYLAIVRTKSTEHSGYFECASWQDVEKWRQVWRHPNCPDLDHRVRAGLSRKVCWPSRQGSCSVVCHRSYLDCYDATLLGHLKWTDCLKLVMEELLQQLLSTSAAAFCPFSSGIVCS